MKTLIVFDSMYGNTQKVAEAMATATGGRVMLAAKVKGEDLQEADVLVAGSPVHGGRASEAIQEFLQRIPAGALKGKKVAAFDTRFAASDQGFGLKLLMRLIDYAAPRIAKVLEAKGGELVAPPEGFIVKGKQGPLRKGEIERSQEWAKKLLSQEKQQV